MGGSGGDMKSKGVPAWVVLLVMFLVVVVYCVVAKAEKVPIEIKRNIYATEWWDTVTVQFRGWLYFKPDFEVVERIPDKNGFLDSLCIRVKRIHYLNQIRDSLVFLILNNKKYVKPIGCQNIYVRDTLPTPPIIRVEIDTIWMDTTTWHPPMIETRK